jgi:hypothetical protein
MLNKRTEYILAGAIGLYIVFMTRPAPTVVSNMLSSPIAQIVALAGVIYVGACHSLIVAVILALAVVLSAPVREFMTDSEKSKTEAVRPDTTTKLAKKPAAKVMPSKMKTVGAAATKPAAPGPSAAPPAAANKPKTPEPSDTKPSDNVPDQSAPAPSGQTLAAAAGSKEHFSGGCGMSPADF